MTGWLFFFILVATDLAVWLLAYHFQPEPTSTDEWRIVERNLRWSVANVAVMAVNIAILGLLRLADRP